MKEYIEREAVLNAFNPNAEANMFENCRLCECLDGAQIHEIIKAIPAADVRAVKRGRWIWTGKEKDRPYCSVCLSDAFLDCDHGFVTEAFCPNCGADMRDENKTPEG